ncbi:MAG: hypothetical protein IPL45_12745 [Actinomycetales bacterium]|nr:hypothetical protein [Actinomycetales bacterium]
MPDANGHDEHPVLTEDDDKAQRGERPPGAFGDTPPPGGDLDPGWRPSDRVRAAAEGLIKEIGREHRPRREDVLPYLMIRAFSPGDRGARPTWPHRPCWESPDILLIDAAYTGPFSPARLVANPTSGRSYRVFVRVWNLGLLPAVGVHVRAWFVNAGFFGGDPSNPAYQPQLIGGAMVQLEDRTRPGAVALVELDRAWDIPPTLTGHECLMATASCPADQWSGTLDSNHDRHVGQRNLTILAGPSSAKDLLFTLGGLTTKAGTLELTHGGVAVTPVLQALAGRTKTEFGVLGALGAPNDKMLRRGVPIGHGQRHLLTMLLTERGWLVADSDKVLRIGLELGFIDKRAIGRGRVHPFAKPLATRRVIDELGVDHAELVGVLVDADAGEALVQGLVQLWDLGELGGADLARALAEGEPAAHLLRFAHHDAERHEDGGYSLVAVG